MNTNPMELLKNFMSNGGGPKALVEKAMANMVGNTNPMIGNLVNMAKQGDTKGVETFANNIYKEIGKGRDFYKDYAEFRNMFK